MAAERCRLAGARAGAVYGPAMAQRAASMVPRPALVSGHADPRFADVVAAYERIVADRPGWSGAVAAYVDGAPAVDLWAGPDYHQDSLQFLFCTTRFVAGVCVALLVERGLLDLDAPVARYWPQFAAAGKTDVAVRQLLSHQAGLISVDGGCTLDEILSHEPAARRLAAQRPYWHPGSGFGYHLGTFGTLVEELCRRVTGEPLGEFYEREVRAPYGIEAYLGLPEALQKRVVALEPPARIDPELLAMWIEFQAQDLPQAATQFPCDLPVDDQFSIARDRRVWRAGPVGLGGIGSARGLARLGAAATTGVDGRAPLLSPATVAAVSATQAAGLDKMRPLTAKFAIVFEGPVNHMPMAGPGSFGHDGLGGSLAYANPQRGVAFGFVSNHPTGFADPLTVELTDVLLACL